MAVLSAQERSRNAVPARLRKQVGILAAVRMVLRSQQGEAPVRLQVSSSSAAEAHPSRSADGKPRRR